MRSNPGSLYDHKTLTGHQTVTDLDKSIAKSPPNINFLHNTLPTQSPSQSSCQSPTQLPSQSPSSYRYKQSPNHTHQMSSESKSLTIARSKKSLKKSLDRSLQPSNDQLLVTVKK